MMLFRRIRDFVGGLFALGSIRALLMAAGGVIVAVLVFLARWSDLVRKGEQNKQLRKQLENERHAREIIQRDRAIAADRPDRRRVQSALEDGTF